MKTDTIAAIATAMTNSGIGIIRISGEDAFTVIDRIYQSKNGKKKLSEEKSHTVHYGYIVDDTKENKIIDEVMVLIMRAPNTYTREDTVEIDCHGGVLMAFLWKKKRLRKYLKRMDIVLLLLVSGIWEVGMNNILIIVDLICFTV